MDYLLRYELCFNVFHLLILLVYFVSVMYAYISIFTFKSTIAYALELTCDCHVGIKGILFIYLFYLMVDTSTKLFYAGLG